MRINNIVRTVGLSLMLAGCAGSQQTVEDQLVQEDNTGIQERVTSDPCYTSEYDQFPCGDVEYAGPEDVAPNGAILRYEVIPK